MWVDWYGYGLWVQNFMENWWWVLTRLGFIVMNLMGLVGAGWNEYNYLSENHGNGYKFGFIVIGFFFRFSDGFMRLGLCFWRGLWNEIWNGFLIFFHECVGNGAWTNSEATYHGRISCHYPWRWPVFFRGKNVSFGQSRIGRIGILATG